MMADMPTCKFGPAALGSALIDAVGSGLPAIVRRLLDKGANVNAR